MRSSRKSNPRAATLLPLQLTSPRRARRRLLFAALDQELTTRTGDTKFDILVNNAGIAPFVSFADTTEDVLDEIYTVNVKSLFLITQEAVKRLKEGGRIISISTGAVRTPFPAVAAYSMLKAPLDNLTKSLAVELGARGITVNAVAPGVIDTDMSAFVRSADGEAFALGKQALKRIGKPDDIADVVSFLAGPKVALGHWTDDRSDRRQRPYLLSSSYFSYPRVVPQLAPEPAVPALFLCPFQISLLLSGEKCCFFRAPHSKKAQKQHVSWL